MLARVTHARIARPLAVDHPPRTAHHLAACALALTLMVAPGLGCGGGEPTSAGAGETGGEDVAETGSETATSSTPGADADSDGLPDHLDRCATERGEARAGGCPPYDADQDGSPRLGRSSRARPAPARSRTASVRHRRCRSCTSCAGAPRARRPTSLRWPGRWAERATSTSRVTPAKARPPSSGAPAPSGSSPGSPNRVSTRRASRRWASARTGARSTRPAA
jgi:hypothetical protein